MENYLMINGKRIDLTDEQVKILSEEPKKGVWRKPKEGEKFWVVTSTGEVAHCTWNGDKWCEYRYKNGNCCLEEEPLERERLDIILYQRLKRFSYQHGWDEKTRKDGEKRKETIWYDIDNEIWKTDWTYGCDRPMQVYFMSEEIAQRAIQEIIKPFCEEFPEYLGGE